MPNQQAFVDMQRLGYYDEKLKTWVEAKYTEITNAEYEALTEEEKNNGVFYYITDLPSVVGGNLQPMSDEDIDDVFND